MKNLIISIALVVVAIIIFAILLIPAIIWGIIISLYKRKAKNGFKELSEWFMTWAISIDQLANVICKDLFNSTLITGNGVEFGNPDETISGVLGKNKRAETLSKIGKGLDWLLEKLDPNHSIKSIEDDE